MRIGKWLDRLRRWIVNVAPHSRMQVGLVRLLWSGRDAKKMITWIDDQIEKLNLRDGYLYSRKQKSGYLGPGQKRYMASSKVKQGQLCVLDGQHQVRPVRGEALMTHYVERKMAELRDRLFRLYDIHEVPMSSKEETAGILFGGYGGNIPDGGGLEGWLRKQGYKLKIEEKTPVSALLVDIFHVTWVGDGGDGCDVGYAYGYTELLARGNAGCDAIVWLDWKVRYNFKCEEDT